MSSNPSATTTAAIYLPVPVGTVISYMGLQANLAGLASLGWLLCDGSQVSSQTYPDLYAAIGTTYGGNGSPNFNLPMLSGFFLRGADPGGKVDPDYANRTSPIFGNSSVAGAVIGSIQPYAIQNHQHTWNNNFGQITKSGSDLNVQLALNSPTGPDLPPQPTTNNDGGGPETRPANVYTYFLIFTGLPQTQQPGIATAEKKMRGSASAGKTKARVANQAQKKSVSAKQAKKKTGGTKQAKKR